MSTHWTTKNGEKIAWADIDDRHLWNIARMLVRKIREKVKLCTGPAETLNEWLRVRLAIWEQLNSIERAAMRRHARRDMRKLVAVSRASLSQAIDELTRRGLIPTTEDLRVAWDRACGGAGGPNHADDPEKRPWCLIELWVGYRGVPTFTPEWLAAQQQVSP
jgi:hypothetical protein